MVIACLCTGEDRTHMTNGDRMHMCTGDDRTHMTNGDRMHM